MCYIKYGLLDMKIKKIIPIFLVLILTGLSTLPLFSESYSYIEGLFNLRTAITDHGKVLPSKIKQASGKDTRTLERIFEMNTSALTAIEAYFRIFKVAITAKSDTDPAIVTIMNEWLQFINTQCSFDLEYINEALKETADIRVMEQLQIARDNIRKLSEISHEGISENAANGKR